MRVIPDVDVNAERSDKQKEESSKFGFLSDMLNKNLEYLKIGFPKAYQSLNYAIKKNISLVSNTENGFVFDFPKAVFSEGKLAPCSPNLVHWVNNASYPFSVRFIYFNDYPGKKDDYDLSYGIIYFPLTKELIIKKTNNFRKNRSSAEQRTFITNLYAYRFLDFYASLFFLNPNSKEVSKTIYFGFYRH